jgi:tRNA-(ms[2]io[6]A)-hydroxylase
MAGSGAAGVKIESPLVASTPSAWVDAAADAWREILIDHANCEKKAASTALSLIFAYPEEQAAAMALSRLAREELRHFEQVTRLMRRMGVPHERLQPSRYATGLRAAVTRSEPDRRVDLLLIGALIEARSCERFGLLAPRLPSAMGELYAGLRAAEARHFELYVELAQQACAAQAAQRWRERLKVLAAVEAELVTMADPQLRFHSGLPA